MATRIALPYSVSVGLHRNHSYWTVNLNTDDSALLAEVNWRTVEQRIEEAAEEHDIALQKTVSMSGRGYKDAGKRVVGVSYKFGSQRNDSDEWIARDTSPISKVEWVGGYRGTPDMLQPSSIRIESVESYTPSLWQRIKRRLWG